MRIFSISICCIICFSGGYWNPTVFFIFGLRGVGKNLYRNIFFFLPGCLPAYFNNLILIIAVDLLTIYSLSALI